MSLLDLKNVLSIAHDLVCSVLLFVIIVLQLRLHSENRSKLDEIRRRLGILERDQNHD
jgi:hypothetical protein